MKKPILALLALVLIASQAAADLRAGAARVDLTPSGRVPLAGYGSRFGKLSEGVHDPVFVRALALESDGRRFVLVASDLIGITRPVREAVVARLPGVRPEDLMLTATHGHSAPGGFSDHPLAFVAAGFPSPERFDAVVAAIALAVTRALASLEPARIGIGTSDLAGFSRNRRVRGGPVDSEGGLVRVVREDGSLLAAWVHFTAHPTLLGGDNLEVSAEWPGALCSALESNHPGAVALFTNGAEGDQSPDGAEGATDFERVSNYGRKIAARVEARLPEIEADGALEIRTDLREVELPRSAFGTLAPRTTSIQRVELDDTVWFAIPGEPVVEIGLALKRVAVAAGARAAFAVGLANDHLGYFTTREGYFSDAYESRMNLYGPGIAEFLVDALTGRPGAAADPPASWRREVDGLDVAFVSGTPREMGLAHGRLYAAEIRVLAREVRRLSSLGARKALSEGGLDPARLLLLGYVEDLALGVASQRLRAGFGYAGRADEVLEMEGIAEGAGVPFDAVFLANHLRALVTPELAGAVFDVATLLGEASRPLPDLGRDPAVGLRFAAGGRDLFGRVEDLDLPLLAGLSTIVVRRPAAGPARVDVGWPGRVRPASGIDANGRASFDVDRALEPERDLETALAAIRRRAGDATLHSVAFDPSAGAIHAWRTRGGLGWVRLATEGLFAGRVPDGAVEARAYGDGSEFVYRHVPFEAKVRERRAPGVLPGETRVDFPSPVSSGIPENDRCYGLLYEPSRSTDRAIVLLPIWQGPTLDLETTVGQMLSAMGYKVLVLPLAYQFERAPRGRSGDLTVSSDLERNRHAMIQSVQDAQRAAWWLVHERGVAADRVAVMGISMGGHVAALAYGATDRFRAGIFVLAGGRVADTLWNDSDETRRIKRELKAAGLTLSDLRGLSRDYDPLTFASPAKGDGVYMVGARYDEIVFPENVRALAGAYGGVDVRWVPAGHYTAWIGLPAILAEIDDHLDERFGK